MSNFLREPDSGWSSIRCAVLYRLDFFILYSAHHRGGHCSNSSLPVRVRTQTGVFERLLLKSYTKSFLNYEQYVKIKYVKKVVT